MKVWAFGLAAVVALVVAGVTRAEDYTYSSKDERTKSAFETPARWTDSKGNVATSTDIFHDPANSFYMTGVYGSYLWDNTSSNYVSGTVYFGTESKAQTMSYKTHQSKSNGYADFADFRWINGSLSYNTAYTYVFDGKWTVTNADGKHRIYMSSSDVTGSLLFRQRLIGASDVAITWDTTKAAWNSWYLRGDLSEWGGQLKPVGQICVLFESDTACGDQTVPRTDAVLLSDGGGFAIKASATLGTNRGVTLTGTSCKLYTSSNYREYTVRFPVTGAGVELEKIGAYVATLDCAYSAGQITVSAGTLALGPNVTFAAEKQPVCVKSGATLNLPNVATLARLALTVEPGGLVTYGDGTIPYDAEQKIATPVDLTACSAAEIAAMPRPIAVRLSNKMTFPILETNELTVMKFPADAALTQEDFTNLTEKTYNLPNTWFRIGTEEGTGAKTLVYVSKPVITRTGKAYNRLSEAKNKDGEFVWVDELAAHPGADYVSTVKIKTWSASDNSVRKFGGDSLYQEGTIQTKSATTYIPNLTLAGGFEVIAGSPKTHRFGGGPYTLLSNMSLVGSADESHNYALDAELLGTVRVSMSYEAAAAVTVYLNGTNRNFRGTFSVTNMGTPDSYANSTVCQISNPDALGGPLDVTTANALVLQKYGRIRPAVSMTLDVANRGITVDGAGGFDVPSGMTLTVMEPIAVSGTLYKTGAGTLAVNGVVGAEADVAPAVAVDGGNLGVTAADALATARLAFADGTGLCLDFAATDADLVAYGLRNPLVGGLSAAGTLTLAVANVGSFPGGESGCRAICTVAADEADALVAKLNTEANLKAVKAAIRSSASGYGYSIVKGEEVDGLVTLSLAWEKVGLLIFLK